MDYKKKRMMLVGGTLGAVILILLISLGFLVKERIFSAKISVTVAPSIATVMVGDKVVGTLGEYEMTPGEYEVKVSAEGFETKTGKLNLKADETVEVKLYLQPNSAETMDWYETHSGDALIAGEIQNAEMLGKVDRLLVSEPVLGRLPLTVEYFSDDMSQHTKYILSYILNDSPRGFYILMKDYTGAGVDAAARKLSEMGMDTTDVEIQYIDMSGDALNARGE